MRKSSRTTGRTPSNTNPNLQDAINNLCPPPPPHSYHQPQHSHHGDPTTPEDHTQVHVVTPTLSSTVPPSSLMDPTSSTTYHAMQVESYGARPSSSIHVDSIVVGSASTIQEHMQENIGQAPPRQRKAGWMSSNVSIGQDQAFNKVCDFLRDDNVGMVGIYGMGGVGKTTLLKKVRKEFLERSHFNVIWIVVSKSIDVDSIQKNIMEEMNLHFNKKELRHKRAKKINKALATNKVGLLFDDIWQSLNMEELGIIGDNDLDTSNFKILFTTRSKKVCTQMDSDKEIIVECLCWDDSWAIFEKCVGKKTLEQADPSVSLLAEKVAKECEGLPLALTVVGRAMTCKYTHQEWKDALNMLQKSRYDVLDPEKNLFNCLKLSYDYLPDHGVKNCFLYCCLFPEDYEMTSSNLAELWVVEGLLAMNGSFMEALNRGYGIIGTLRAACLLEKGSSDLKVKMHDVIRDMGLWILSESKLNYFVHGLSHMTNVEINYRWREAHKLFVWDRDKLPEQPLCHNLTTLLIVGQSLEVEIPNGFFKSMCKVRVLQLWRVQFLDPPVAIGHLVELRYFSLFRTNDPKL